MFENRQRTRMRKAGVTLRVVFLGCLFLLLPGLVRQPLNAQEKALSKWAEDMIKKYGAVPAPILHPPASIPPKPTLGTRLRTLLFSITGTRHSTSGARFKACYANQRVILGAVEMYNLDHSATPKTRFSHADAATPAGDLVAGSYLKTPVTLVDVACRYDVYGNPSDDGLVYCRHHGAFDDDQQQALRMAAGYVEGKTDGDQSLEVLVAVLMLLTTLSCMGAWLYLKRQGAGTAEAAE